MVDGVTLVLERGKNGARAADCSTAPAFPASRNNVRHRFEEFLCIPFLSNGSFKKLTTQSVGCFRFWQLILR